jgi:hypothetical protein
MPKSRTVRKNPKKTNNLRVSLDMQTTPWSVIVDETTQDNEVRASRSIQVIKWYLVGNAAAGKFVRFRWNKPPKTGIFGPFLIDECCGKRATMCDLYKDNATKGEWGYQLTIEFAGNTYSSIPQKKDTGTPNIKNN